MKSKVSKPKPPVNTAKLLKNEVRKGWNEQFKKAFLNGELPDENEFAAIQNVFDEREW
jgi:hypothetical protein